MTKWRTNHDASQISGDLIIMGELCPCDGFQSVKAVKMLNKNGKWDDIKPLLIHKSNLVEISEPL